MFERLKVVLWKNLLIRKRHWLLSLCESLLPAVLFLMIAYGRSKINGLNRVEHDVTHNYKQEVNYLASGLNLGETHIYYSPDNVFYSDLIHSVQEKFSIINNNVKRFPNEKSLLDHYKQSGNRETLIAIIFNSENPRKLDYTIRYHQQGLKWETEKLYNYPFNFEPGMGSTYQHRGFLALQKALDMSYIEKMGYNKTDNILIEMLEFPYPPHRTDTGLTGLFFNYLPLVTMFSFIFVCPAVIKRVVEEKHSGIKELMKMVGMRSWMLWLGWFIYSILPMIFSVILIMSFLKLPLFGSNYPVIEYTSAGVVLLFLLLYTMAIIALAFFITTLFNKPTLAMLVGLLFWLLSYFVPTYILDSTDRGVSVINSLAFMLLPNMALQFGYSTIALYEEREIGVQWNNWCVSPDGASDGVKMSHVCTMLIVDFVVFVILTFYVDAINPGKYGIKKSALYPIQYIIHLIKYNKNTEVGAHESNRLEVLEKGNFNKGIELICLTKKFGKKVAVNNLSMDIYKDQITVLLGHNGAGKSTTIGMLTGMLRKTDGKIVINGKEINSRSALSNSIGLCTQHNLFFPDLTVSEHLKFFSMLKGRTCKQSETETKEILEKMSLSEKCNEMAQTLSGGMKRKLCLGMAVIGGSEILILDEPSSGMDPESRRHLWDLLLSWRNEKTILITTHFMDEADALGDWIAIMEEGYLRCFGTPMALKTKYKTGYHLKLLIKSEANIEDAVEMLQIKIKTYLPLDYAKNYMYSRVDGNEVLFLLPIHNKYTDLFDYLEKNMDELNIESISFTLTTLEDVFLGLKPSTTRDNTDYKKELVVNKKNSPTYWTYLTVLFFKRWLFIGKKLRTYIIPAFIAVLFLVLCIFLSDASPNIFRKDGQPLKINLTAYGKTTVHFNSTQDSDILKMKGFYHKLVNAEGSNFIESKDVSEAIVKEGIQNLPYYRLHMVASAEFKQDGNEYQIVGLYNNLAKHSAPISLNLITNTLTKTFLGEDFSISFTNYPLKDIDTKDVNELSVVQVGLLWLMILPVGVLFFLGSFIYFPHSELSTNFTQLQFMCGIPPWFYWITLLIGDYLLFIVFALLMSAVSMAWAPFRGSNGFGSMFAILILYAISGIPYAYLFSRRKSFSGSYALFIIIGIVSGVIPCILVLVLTQSQDDYYINIGNHLEKIFLIFLPQFALTYLGVNFSDKVIENFNFNHMPYSEKLAYCSSNPENPCCNNSQSTMCATYQSFLPFIADRAGLIFVSASIYFIINIVLHSYFMKKYWNRMLNMLKTRRPSEVKDTELGDGYFTVRRLRKQFSGKEVVSDVTFNLKEGECLGLLGANGAGKTTTFRMLTREEIKDGGKITNNISADKEDYIKKMGYCPQNDALNFSLTGRQILTVMAKLRGEINVEDVVENYLNLFELKDLGDIPCEYYSGGNKRKLSFAVAAIGLPDIILLDEPTNGVDPATRRKLWTLIKNMKDQKVAFILTSHSMSECEALCNDVKIMKNGTIKRAGQISKLKSDMGGVSVKLKLKHILSIILETDQVDKSHCSAVPSFKSVRQLKDYLLDNYPGEVKSEHPGYLHYYIKNKAKRWSDLFREFDHLQTTNQELIEDYCITDASLEDIFMDVAQGKDGKQKERNKKTKEPI